MSSCGEERHQGPFLRNVVVLMSKPPKDKITVECLSCGKKVGQKITKTRVDSNFMPDGWKPGDSEDLCEDI